MHYETNKLFKITTQDHSKYYVVGTDPTAAYEKLETALRQWGITAQSVVELSTIELIAEQTRHPGCRTLLLT